MQTIEKMTENKLAELLVSGCLEHVAKISGCEVILSIGRSKGLIETHRGLGYTIDKDPSYEISKKIV